MKTAEFYDTLERIYLDTRQCRDSDQASDLLRGYEESKASQRNKTCATMFMLSYICKKLNESKDTPMSLQQAIIGVADASDRIMLYMFSQGEPDQQEFDSLIRLWSGYGLIEGLVVASLTGMQALQEFAKMATAEVELADNERQLAFNARSDEALASRCSEMAFDIVKGGLEKITPHLVDLIKKYSVTMGFEYAAANTFREAMALEMFFMCKSHKEIERGRVNYINTYLRLDSINSAFMRDRTSEYLHLDFECFAEFSPTARETFNPVTSKRAYRLYNQESIRRAVYRFLDLIGVKDGFFKKVREKIAGPLITASLEQIDRASDELTKLLGSS